MLLFCEETGHKVKLLSLFEYVQQNSKWLLVTVIAVYLYTKIVSQQETTMKENCIWSELTRLINLLIKN